jgi:hypothetical protein
MNFPREMDDPRAKLTVGHATTESHPPKSPKNDIAANLELSFVFVSSAKISEVKHHESHKPPNLFGRCYHDEFVQ